MPYSNLDKVGHLLFFVRSPHKKNKFIFERLVKGFSNDQVVF